MSICQQGDCTQEARGALRTRRPERDNVTTQVWWDDRAAKVPKAAEKLCRQHLLQTLLQIGTVLLDTDAPVARAEEGLMSTPGGAPELEPIELGPEHLARVQEDLDQAEQAHAASMEKVLADAQASARRLADRMKGGPEIYGGLCVTCEQRYALRPDKASCAHKDICEDCWPNGCKACEDEMEEGIRHREIVTSRIIQCAMEIRSLADDLSDTDLDLLDWRATKDVKANVALAIESLRRIGDELARREVKPS